MTVSVWWSVGLSTLAICVTWLVGSKKSAGWLLATGVQALWITYAVATRQWGFLASAVVFGILNTRNYVKWRRDELAAGDLEVK